MATQKKQKKQTTKRTYTVTQTGIVRILAFCGILFAAIVFTVGGILSWLGLGSVSSVLNLIAQISLLIAVAIPGYEFVKYRNMTWKVVYAIALVIYVFGCVFGVFGFYFK